jgi:hypothetical protein
MKTFTENVYIRLLFTTILNLSLRAQKVPIIPFARVRKVM